MKVTGKTFCWIKIEGDPRGKIPKISKLLGKKNVTGQDSGFVKQGHSFFIYLHASGQIKSRVCPRFKKIVYY